MIRNLIRLIFFNQNVDSLNITEDNIKKRKKVISLN